MTPKFAQAVDPIFLHVLDLLDRLNDSHEASPQDERLQIIALLDRAEAIVGRGREWELAKYALVSWIDEMLVETPWSGGDWWSNNVLEVELFNTRVCYEQFYARAQEASGLPHRDALEVFYVCVVMGFRGMYRDTQMAQSLLQAHGLPQDLAAWAKQTSMAIQLGQGRPPQATPRREIEGAPPLRGKTAFVWSGFAVAALVLANVVVYFLFLFE